MKERLRAAWAAVVSFGFRLLYNEMAYSYDAVSWVVSLGGWRAWQRASLQHLQGKRILEVGHGPGHMLLELGQAGYRVTAIELSAAMVRMAHRRIGRSPISADQVRGRAEELPFADEVFDVVLSTFPAAFILNQATAESIFRTLRPGGRLVIVLGARFAGMGWVERVLERFYKNTGQRADRNDPYSDVWSRFEEPFVAVGFEMRLERVPISRATVFIVIGDKGVAG